MGPVHAVRGAFAAVWFVGATLASAQSPIASMTQLFDGAMRPDLAVQTLSHTERLLPVRTVRRGERTEALPRRTAPFPAIHFRSDGHDYDLYDYLAVNRVAGLLILKDGAIALEDYELGADPRTRWASFSMAKSVTSTLTGAAVADGYIKSLDDPADSYVPALRKDGYAGVTIRQILTMSSGVRWNETYTDPASDRRKVLDLQLSGRRGAVIAYMAALPRAADPGTVWNYNTGETFVLGAIVEAATHRPLTTYLSEKIWSRAGMEEDATWWVEGGDGMTWAGSGLGATLRDYGRFGLFAANEGRIDDKSILPAGWFADAGAPRTIGGSRRPYGYMWWIPPQDRPISAGAFEAEGIFGQHLYIHPHEHLVIVVLSARSKPTGSLELDDDAFFAAVADALHGAGGPT